MPENASGPHGAILLHRKCKLWTPTKLQKEEKKAFPNEVTIIVGSIAETIFDVPVFCLADQNPFHTLPR